MKQITTSPTILVAVLLCHRSFDQEVYEKIHLPTL